MTMTTHREVTSCRVCSGTKLVDVLNLGEQYIVDFIPEDEKVDTANRVPLVLMVCETCKLVQLRHSVNPDRMYRQFWYKSGINESMVDALQDVLESAKRVRRQCANPDPLKRVLDIGSNDGTYLSFFGNHITKVGFDPARNLKAEAMEKAKTEHIYDDYFQRSYVGELRQLTKDKGFDIITAIAMFYDLEDPHEFLSACRDVLASDGVIVIQMNYLSSMLYNNAFDNISHEHLCYYTLTSLLRVVNACDLSIVDVETNDVNGGSIRVFIKHARREVDEDAAARVRKVLTNEMNSKFDDILTYKEFGQRVDVIKKRVTRYLREHPLSVFLYGASTRGTTLMQYFYPEGTQTGIVAAAERNPEKFGRRMVGTWIPIISEEQARQRARTFLVLPWHFKNNILQRESDAISHGVKFLFPLPYPHVVSQENL